MSNNIIKLLNLNLFMKNKMMNNLILKILKKIKKIKKKKKITKIKLMKFKKKKKKKYLINLKLQII